MNDVDKVGFATAEALYQKVIAKSQKPWEGKRMELNEYQKLASKTANFHGCLDPIATESSLTSFLLVESLIYCTMGLTGEAGEVAELTKKLLRDDHLKLTDDRKEKYLGEIGDVLWYVSNLAGALGFTLEQVAEYNIQKLKKRHGIK